ncbi:unnamed protein product [Acanthoscelides obtectus]|uniref:Uncharacterized protein n=1 Tax=Acanthoscelides obtectus TaxID=200917 RepID=A0A9P0LRX5_ACAOB|nr:unnamed protein product [Acanthoscelides obtectus]CAK1624022.1 hypothetical protein AOBTE_LOCUS2288 [Acanthoscelides obtectus]
MLTGTLIRATSCAFIVMLYGSVSSSRKNMGIRNDSLIKCRL